MVKRIMLIFQLFKIKIKSSPPYRRDAPAKIITLVKTIPAFAGA
ncbi:MAG: hypothetical protein PHS62_04330 [Patescibacteria group bacterium]|nr:hypothetical protein [Patescibacteria group bacterium]